VFYRKARYNWTRLAGLTSSTGAPSFFSSWVTWQWQVTEANEMTATAGYTQTYNPRSRNRTTAAEPLVLLPLEKVAHIGSAGRYHAGSSGGYTKRYPALDP